MNFFAHEQDIAEKGLVKHQADVCELLNKQVVFLWEFLDRIRPQGGEILTLVLWRVTG